jgi:hypothetical protein
VKYPAIVCFGHPVGHSADLTELTDKHEIKLTPLPEAPQMRKCLAMQSAARLAAGLTVSVVHGKESPAARTLTCLL